MIPYEQREMRVLTGPLGLWLRTIPDVHRGAELGWPNGNGSDDLVPTIAAAARGRGKTAQVSKCCWELEKSPTSFRSWVSLESPGNSASLRTLPSVVRQSALLRAGLHRNFQSIKLQGTVVNAGLSQLRRLPSRRRKSCYVSGNWRRRQHEAPGWADSESLEYLLFFRSGMELKHIWRVVLRSRPQR